MNIQRQTQLATFGPLGPDLACRYRMQDAHTALVCTTNVFRPDSEHVAVFCQPSAATPLLDIAVQIGGIGVHYMFNLTQREARRFLMQAADSGDFPVIHFNGSQVRSYEFAVFESAIKMHEALWDTEDRPEVCSTQWARACERLEPILAEEFAGEDEDLVHHLFVRMHPERMHHMNALAALRALTSRDSV